MLIPREGPSLVRDQLEVPDHRRHHSAHLDREITDVGPGARPGPVFQSHVIRNGWILIVSEPGHVASIQTVGMNFRCGWYE